MANGKNRVDIQVGFSVDKSGLKDLTSSLQNIQKEATKASSQGTLSDDLKRAGAAAKELQQILNKSWNENLNQLNLNKFNDSIKKSYGSVSQLKTELQKSGASGIAAFNQLASTVLNTNIQLRQSSKILDNFATTFKNTIRYGISSSIFNRMASSIEQAFNYSKKLDSSLNDIRIVTDKSADSMEKFAQQANEASKSLGASTLDYTNASLIYYQQGLSDAEVAARAETTIKAANVTGQTGEEVSEQLTAVWNGYKVTAEEAELYVDKLAAVAATTAADLEELSVGMSKVASAANAMGVDFDDLNAQIATIVSVTRQAPESVGTALKTIYARLGDLKVDGIDEFGVSLGEVSSQMVKMGIQILDQEGNLRDMSSVIAEVAQKWQGWTEAQRQAAAVAMAGKRQYNNLIALFDNWDMYTDALNTSSEAMGTLQHQQDIYMESTAAHLKALRTETERTYDILFDTKTANNFVDIFSGVLNQFNDLIEGLGGGTNVLLNFGAVAANVFNKQIGKELNLNIESLKEYINQVRLAKNQQEMITEVAKQDVKHSYAEQGINYNESSKAVQVEAQMRKEILSVSKYITQEEFQQLATNQKKAGEFERQIENLYDYRNVFKQQFNDAEYAEENLNIWYKDQLRTINDLTARYEAIKEITEQINSMNFSDRITSIDYVKEEISQVMNDEVLSEERRIQLQQIYNQLNNDNLTTKQKAQLIEENSSIILSSQRQILRDIKNTYDQVYEAEEKRRSVEDGIDEKLKAQSLELQRQNQEQIKSAQNAMRISSIVSRSSGLIQGISAAIGGLNTGLKEGATGAEKANAIFAGTSGILSGIANYLLPGSGILVQGVLSLGKGVLELTGLWDNFEDLLKSTDEKLSEMNTRLQQLASNSENFNIGLNKLEEIADEYDRLSSKAGSYDSAIDKLTSTERERYNELKNTILKYNQEALLGYNDRGEAIIKENEGIQETINLLKEKYDLEVQEYYNGKDFEKDTKTLDQIYKDARKKYEGSLEEIEMAKEGPGSKENVVRNMQEELASFTLREGIETETTEAIKTMLQEGSDYIIQNKDEFYNYIDILSEDESFKDFHSALFDWRNRIEAISEDLSETEKFAEEQFKIDSAIKVSPVLNAVKNLSQYKDSYNELVKVAETSGVDDIDTYIISYINGLQLGEDAENYDEVYQLVANFNEKILNILKTNPDLIREISQSANELGQQTFNSYQEYVIALEEKIKSIFEDESFKQLPKEIQEALLKTIFGISDIDIDEDGSIQKIEDKLTSATEKLKDHINDLWGQDATQEEVNSLINPESEADVNYIIENLEQAKLKTDNWQESIKLINDQLKISKELSEAINNVDFLNSGIFETLKEGKELSDDQVISLEKLEEKYLELGEAFRVAGRESREYSEILRQVQEVEEENQQSLLKEQLQLSSKALDENINKRKTNTTEEGRVKQEIEIAANMDDVTEAISDVFDKKYELEVSLTEDILSDIDNIIIMSENAADVISKIGRNFEVAAEDAESLFAVFPELAESAQVLADGTIKLNQDVTTEILKNYGIQIDADKEKTVQEINNRIEELKSEKAKVEATLEAVQNQHMTEDQLEQITKDYCLNANDEIATSDKNAADAAITNSGIMAQAIIDNWAACAAAAKEYSDMVPQAVNGTLTDATITGGKITLTGATVEAKTDGSSKNVDEALEKQRKAVEEGLKKQVESYEKQIADLTVGASKLLSSTNNIEKAAKSSLEDKDKSKKSGGKDKKEEELKKLEDEFDRYWDINHAIEELDRSLKKLEKDQKNLYGKELIRSLKQENELLENQAQLYNQLLEAQKEEAAELRGVLANSGVAFDASGAVINYAEATAAALERYNQAIKDYNAGLLDDAALEIHKQEYERFKKDLERYEKLYYEEIKQTEEKLDDIHRKELENNLKAWEVEVQLKLDWQELYRGWNDFIKEVTEDFQKVFKDLRLEAKNMLADASTYVGEEGTVNTVINAIHDVMDEIDKIEGGGESDMFESISQAQEKLKELNDQLLDSGKALHQLWVDAWDNYLDGIQQVDDALGNIIERYEQIDEELEFQGKLIELLYGEEAYNLLTKLYEGQEQNLMGQVKSVKQQVDMWKELFEATGASMDNQLDWEEDQKEYYEKWMAAQSQLNDLTIEYIELLKKDYLNTVESILKQFETAITNGSTLAKMNEEWERISANADKYYDSVEGAYYIQSLANKIDQGIAGTSDLKAQQKLMALREREIGMLREKENLTEYDLKAAEMRYEIALKEIALQESQNSKTGMKLTRNEQGNWSYQYVADEEDVATKQQELLDAYNNLYQLASDAYEANLEALMELQEKYIESAREIAENDTLTEEERQEQLAELREWYLEEYKNLSEENQLYRNDLAASGAALLLEIYEQDQEAYQNMTDAEKELVNTLVKANIEDYQELDRAVKGDYKDMSDAARTAYKEIETKSKQVMEDTRRDWTSGAQTLATKWNGDNGQSVKNQVINAYEKIEDANTSYQEAVDELAEVVDRNFNEDGIIQAINDAEDATRDLEDATKEMVEESIPYLIELREYVDEIEQAWRSVEQAIYDAIAALEEYLQKVGEVNEAEREQAEIKASAPTAPKVSSSGGSGSGGGSGGGGNKTNNNDVAYYTYKATAGDEDGTTSFSHIYEDKQSALSSIKNYDTGSVTQVGHDETGKAIEKKVIEAFATGGYTGSWDDLGKLAILHEKELVLNADDTKNFLDGIMTIRDLVNSNGSIQEAVLKAAAHTIQSLGNISGNNSILNNNTNNDNNTTENIFNINAEFPNANNVDEIREAILTLPNLASQYINTNLR